MSDSAHPHPDTVAEIDGCGLGMLSDGDLAAIRADAAGMANPHYIAIWSDDGDGPAAVVMVADLAQDAAAGISAALAALGEAAAPDAPRSAPLLRRLAAAIRRRR